VAFIVEKRPHAAAPIKTTVLNAKGEPVVIDFVALYQRHSHADLVKMQNGFINRGRLAHGQDLIPGENGEPPAEAPYATDADLIKSEMKGWLGVEDENGATLSFTPSTPADLLRDYPELVVPLVNGFFEAHKEAAQKN